MYNKYTRARGYIPQDYLGFGNTTNHFHAGGGLNLRGYSGYLVPSENNNNNIDALNYQGISGGAINLELEFTNYLPKFIKKTNIKPYVFADAGTITNEKITTDNIKDAFIDIRSDAGIGFTYSIRNFNPLETIKPLTLRFDMPLFLNAIPNSDDQYIKMRWLIGINKAF